MGQVGGAGLDAPGNGRITAVVGVAGGVGGGDADSLGGHMTREEEEEEAGDVGEGHPTEMKAK